MDKPAVISVAIVQEQTTGSSSSERESPEFDSTQPSSPSTMGNCLTTTRKRAPKPPSVGYGRVTSSRSFPLVEITALPFTRSDFSFVESPSTGTSKSTLVEIPLRSPVGVLLTQEARPHKVLRVAVTLDFPGQECNYHIGNRRAGSVGREKREITIVLTDMRVGGAIMAVRRKRFPNGFVWDQGVVVDCGGISGVWMCEFLGMWEGKQVLERAEAVDVVVEEGDYGFGCM